MSDITSSLKKHKRQPNMCRQSRMSLAKGKNIGPYEILDLLKEGSSSKIYLARSKYTNEYVAIKAINKSPLKNNLDELLLITKQIETLKILKHRNIVTLYEIYESKKYIYLITEYLSGKDLIEKIIHKKRFNEEEALRIFFQLLDAFTYMHKMNICHRNIRTEHILFDKNNRPKIVGFGYSSFYESNKVIEGAYGSLCYACPEIIDEMPYNPELADVWSLGVILYVLICGYLPFSDEDDNKNKILISNGKIDFPKEISNKLKDLLRHMLDKNPNKRYTFAKIIKHPWIKPYGENLFSKGINIHKTIFPVDDRILNIINEYGLDKNKVKNDLIMNKYNMGTGLYKQIVRKLLDLKIKNISDLWSEEFVVYRDDEKNKYDDGDKKYDEYIEKIDEKYKNKEDFINDFKQREDKVVERLLYLKEKKEEKDENKKNKKKEELNIIEEGNIDDGGEENYIEKNNKSEDENEKKDKENVNQNNIKTIKTHKLFPRTKTPMFNFDVLMKARKFNKSNYNTNSATNNNNNLLNDDDEIQIVYNKDQDVDIIQQFQEEQNKKLSENIIIENPTHKKVPSTPNFGKEADNNTTVISETNPFKLSITPDKNENLAQKILGKKQNNDDKSPNTKEETKSIISNNNKNSIYSNLNTKNSLNSHINNININNSNIKKNNSNYFKSIISGNTLYTFNSNSNNNSKSLLRMTTVSKLNSKSHLSRGSLYDDFLKKNHPDNVRKTMLKKSSLGKMNNISNINEGIKENDESETEENEEINKNEEKEKKEIDKELKKSLKLKYSLSFDDDDNEEENEDEQSLYSKEDDLKLFNILNNENDEELKELKKFYFNEDANDKDKDNNEKEKEKKNEKKPKSILKKKSVKIFTGDKEKDKEKSPDSNLKKSIVSKKSITSNNNYNLSNSVLEGLDQYEEKLKEINKNYQITNDKDDGLDANSGRMRFGSQLEISFHDDNDDKLKINLDDNYSIFSKDNETIKKFSLDDSKDMGFSIGDIFIKYKKEFLLKINKDKPNKKINIFEHNDNFNEIDKINELFLKKEKKKENKEKIKKNENKPNGILNKDIMENENKKNKENNGGLSEEENIVKEKEKKSQRKVEKKLTDGEFSRRKILLEKNKKNSIDKNIPIQKDESNKINKIEIFPSKKTIKSIQDSFSIYPKYKKNKKEDNLSNSNYYNDENNTYNGNNQIEYNKYKKYNNIYNENTYNPNLVNYDSFMNDKNEFNNNGNENNKNNKKAKDINPLKYNQSHANFSFNVNKDNKINKALKKNNYKNDKNIKVNPDTLKVNKTKYLPKSPKSKELDENENYSTLNKFNTNKQLQKFKSHYKKYEDMTNNLYYTEEQKFTKTFTRKKAEYNSVKDIKDEVISKRNEIVEKIQHCQNLLNTIMKDKKHLMSNNRNNNKNKNLETNNNKTFTYKKDYLSNKKNVENNKIIKKQNMQTFNNVDNLNQKIKNIYINNNEPKIYKRINVKHNTLNSKTNTKISIENIYEDKNDDNISLPDNFTNNKNNIMRTCLKKDLKNNILANSNYSFDDQRKLNKKNEILTFPEKKLIEVYKKYDNDNKSFSNTYSYINLNKKDSKDKQIGTYTKNIYNTNEQINSKSSKTRKIKNSKNEKKY